MEYMEIRKKVATIVSQISGFEECLDTDKYDELFLTGQVFKVSARDMVYLYFEICDCFNIEISVDKIRNYDFASIYKITNLLCQRL